MKNLVKELIVMMVCVFGVILVLLTWDWTNSLFLTIFVGLLMIGVACLLGMVIAWISESDFFNKVREEIKKDVAAVCLNDEDDSSLF